MAVFGGPLRPQGPFSMGSKGLNWSLHMWNTMFNPVQPVFNPNRAARPVYGQIFPNMAKNGRFFGHNFVPRHSNVDPKVQPLENPVNHQPLVRCSNHQTLENCTNYQPLVSRRNHQPFVRCTNHQPLGSCNDHQPLVRCNSHLPLLGRTNHQPFVRCTNHQLM